MTPTEISEELKKGPFNFRTQEGAETIKGLILSIQTEDNNEHTITFLPEGKSEEAVRVLENIGHEFVQTNNDDKLVASTRWLHLYETPSGWTYATRIKRDKLHAGVKKSADAVQIFAEHTDESGKKTLVVIKEWRHPIASRAHATHIGLTNRKTAHQLLKDCGWEWSTPAGLIDDGESPQDAARRELREETGLEMTEVCAISPARTYSSAGLTDETVRIVVCKCKGKLAEKPGVDGERIEVTLANREKLEEICDSGDAVSGRAWSIFYQLTTTGRFGNEFRIHH